MSSSQLTMIRNLTLQYNTNCLNVSHEWDSHELEDRNKIFKQYQGWLLLPFTVLASAMTTLYVLAVGHAIREHRVSRKFYALLLNRSIGDLISCFCTYLIIGYVLTVDHINGNWIQILNIFYMSCFWSAMVSYIGIGFMKLYGMARPLHYRNHVTMRRTKQLIVLSWALFLAMVVVSLTVTALTKMPALSEWSGCRVETCLVVLYRARNIVMAADYFTTIACYVLTVLLIKKARKISRSMQSSGTAKQQMNANRRFRFPLIKLTVPVLTLAIFHLPFVAVIIRLLFADQCYGLRHYNYMQKVFSYIRACLLIRIILDPSIALFMDAELRRSLCSVLNIPHPLAPKNSLGRGIRPNRSTMSATISSTESGGIECTLETAHPEDTLSPMESAGNRPRRKGTHTASTTSAAVRNGKPRNGITIELDNCSNKEPQRKRPKTAKM